MSASLNWTKILSKCSPSVRKTILETRSHHEDLRRQISELRSTLPKLDFSAYRQSLPKEMAKTVDEAEKQFKAYKVKKVDVTGQLKELEQERELKIKMSQEFIINLESQVDKLKNQLHKLETAKPVDDLTVEDVYEMNPELREKVHEMIKNDHWAVSSETSTTTTATKDTKKELAGEDVKEKLNYL